MTGFREVLLRWSLKKTLRRRCPDSISRSGEDGKAVNCFTVHLRNSESEITVDSFDGDQLQGRGWSGEQFDTSVSLSLPAALEYEVQIEHFYGLDGVVFKGLRDFLFHQFTGIIYLRIHGRRAADTVAQFVFNRRSLRSRRRLAVLRYLVSRRHLGNDRDLGPIAILNSFYSKRWMRHPQHQERLKEMIFMLDSLLVSRDVEKVGSGYRATPQAVMTLETAEESDRRHREISRLQFGVLAFTAVLAAAAVIQVITSLRQ